jgi:hypothetical protein
MRRFLLLADAAAGSCIIAGDALALLLLDVSVVCQ